MIDDRLMCNTTLANPQTYLNDVTMKGEGFSTLISQLSGCELRTKDLEKIQLLHQRSRSAARSRM